MRLAVFRSLASKSNRLPEPSIPVLQRIQECASESCFQGAELSSFQVTKAVVEQCSSLNVQVLCKLTPKDTDDAFRQLDALSLELSKVEDQNVGDVIRLIVVEEPLALLRANNKESSSTSSSLDYLLDVLPVAAQFMETHPTIGLSKGERNTHGNPLDNHVLGVCHRLRLPRRPPVSNNDEFPSSVNDETLQQVMDILDVLPPTRLSLDAATSISLETSVHGRKGEMDAWDMEPLIQGIDHFEFAGWNPPRDNGAQNGLHQQVWKWQSEVQVKETYASCSDAATAKSLHDYFQ
mmetsp:Transcript_16372/g.39987  ORF Transcript_16372/g.39987 Transcript_16372/m.39987 type:complete len:293 (+) Transcript_16372:17-895(+)